MTRAIINFLLCIKTQFLREKAFRFLLSARAFFVRNMRTLLKQVYRQKEVPSSDYYANTNLGKELEIKYQGIDKALEIDPTYFLQASFVNFVLQNYNYLTCVEIGSYRGELLNILSKNNPNIQFRGYDINPTIQEINNAYHNKNLKFLWQENEIIDFSEYKDGKPLLITKAAFMYYSEKKLIELFEKAKEAGLDIALAEPTRYQYNHHSKELSRNFKTGHIGYSHPYSLLLKKTGYNIIYDSNMMNLGYYFTKEYKPYFLTLVYASLKHSNKFVKPLDQRLKKLSSFCNFQ